jgi:catechol 2,3-dioxygenase-like lactoylglutathione lyase family enzyme
MPSLCQVALCTADLPGTARIFVEVLGFADAGGKPRWGADAAQIQELPTGDDTRCMMWWLVGRQEFVQLELFHHTSPAQRPRRPEWRPCDLGWVRFGVVVDDFDRTLRRLHRAGLPTLTPPLIVNGARRVCVREPGADTIVEVMEAGPEFPGPGPAIGYVTVSVSDLGSARRYFGEAFGLEEIEPDAVHRPEHETLWGLGGARRTCAVFRTSGALLEVTQYEAPSPRPPVADALLSDQGIMNAAIGYRDRAEMLRAHTAATALGATATTDVPSVSGSVYLRLAGGISFELLLVPHGLDEVYGFAPQGGPPCAAPVRGRADARTTLG